MICFIDSWLQARSSNNSTYHFFSHWIPGFVCLPVAGPVGSMSKGPEKPKGGEKVDVYKLGAVLGKGGFGTVYSSLDEEKGGFYAIKQVNLSKIPKDQLNGIMQEIDLLKNLNHLNIVKYIKYIKTKDNLFIVLELVENGSLSSIVKKFGKFPENLVCVYITQVLDGLVYLHEQGVVHRDIKGANILTTKEGVIKLADFGVATKFGDESAAVVAGTPYWMAPEIIELNGSTTASDIWSVGCTVIELLTGDPPYYDLGPMPALFRIVQDDYPPLPEGISPALKDWLMQCFQKDPVLRISAQKLLKHKWITAKRKDVIMPEISENPEVLIEKRNKKLTELQNQPIQPPKIPSADATTNNTLANSGKGATSSAGGGGLKLAPRTAAIEEDFDEMFDDDFGDGSIRLEKLDKLNLSNTKSSPSSPASKTPDKGKSNLSPLKTALLNDTKNKHEDKPKPKPVITNNNNATNNDKRKSYIEEDDEDWGDVATPPSGLKLANNDVGKGSKINVKDDGKKKPLELKGTAPVQDKGKEASNANGLDKWKEKDDDDFGLEGTLQLNPKLVGSGSVSKLSVRGGRGDRSAQSVMDAFDHIDDDLEIFEDFEDEEDLIRIDLWTKMSEDTLKLMNKLQLHQGEAVIVDAAQQLSAVFKDNPTQKSHLIRNLGVIPIMEVLEGTNPRVIHSILQVVNQIVEGNLEIKENLCLVGGIPVIMKFSVRDYSLPIRLECANFISQMCSTSTLTLQMFIACRGLPILVDILSTSYNESKKLVWMAAESICSVFELQSTTPKNDFCRLFSRAGLLPVLASVLRTTAEDPEAIAKQLPDKIANLFLFFSSADGVVKLAMSQPEVLAGVFEPLDHNRLSPDITVKILKAVKQLSMDHNVLTNMFQAGTIRRLVRVLARPEGPTTKDIQNHTLNALYNLCRLDQERQYQAAQDGVVPHLVHIISSESPLRQFALPLMCDLAHVKRARAELWKHHSVEFYLNLLSDKYWTANALDSLSVWLMDDTDKVEKIMANKEHIEKIVDAFEDADFTTFANMMEPLLHIVEASVKVNVGLGTSNFVKIVTDRLTIDLPKAEVRVNLLRILTRLYKCHPNPKQMIADFNLYPVVKGLTIDKIVLVQKLASQLLVAFNGNTVF